MTTGNPLTAIGHSDLISNFTGDLQYLTLAPDDAQVSMKTLKSLRPLVVLASLCPFEIRNGKDYRLKTMDVWQRWMGFRAAIETTPSFQLLDSFSAIDSGEADQIQLLLHLEGADPIKKPNELEQFALLGGRALALTWNPDNQYAGGAFGSGQLTPLGKELLERALELQLAVDVSHLNEESFWQVLEAFPGPVFASHSNARELADSPRNLTRRQLHALRARQAWVGISFARSHLTTHSQSTLHDVTRQCDYLAEHLGPELIGLGTDFGGIVSGTPQDLETIGHLPSLYTSLSASGWTAAQIENLQGGNFFRFARQMHWS